MTDDRKKQSARFGFIPHPSSVIPGLRRAFRGEVNAREVALEIWRRGRAQRARNRERAELEGLSGMPARLRPEYARMSPAALLSHFRNRTEPAFFPGCRNLAQTSKLQRGLFPFETAQLLESAGRIVDKHCWPLLGFGEKCFGDEINWLRDPLSGADWPLDFHADVQIMPGGGSDARVLWELNRLAHLITVARAYVVSNDERFSVEVFAQLSSWRAQNPLGRGPNWACAMEVALRAMNLLVTFELLRESPQLDERSLPALIQSFDQHGAHIRRNLEFSYLTTSNHYLSDVVGLLWLGLLLPELEAAASWRTFGLREMLREMDKQVLADGADAEASTGYHRLVLELFLYSFVLCKANNVEIDDRYWDKLRKMLEYVRAYLRPDGHAPLIGDADSGQILLFNKHAADDHAYVLALGAELFDEPSFRIAKTPEEVLWVFGDKSAEDADREAPSSLAFPQAGTYVLRDGDLYLLLNTSGAGLNGRGSHGHNDALSIEVSACGTSFIVDPGTYVYSADLDERHQFRTTAYHSTLEIDGEEQNSIDVATPFVIGDEAQPRVLAWESNAEFDDVIAEHDGYRRLKQPVTHRRAIRFEKNGRWWRVEDALSGAGEHALRFRFHFADGLDINVPRQGTVSAKDEVTGARLFVVALDAEEAPALEPRFISRDYGSKCASISVCWTINTSVPCSFRWVIIPVCSDEDESARLRVGGSPMSKV